MERIPGNPWQHSAILLTAWLLPAALVGAAIGAFWQVLCAALAIALGWHYWQLSRLLTRLKLQTRFARPRGYGLLHEVAQRIFERQREAKKRRKRLQGLLRTFRSAAAALPDAILVVRKPGVEIEWFNEAAIALLGLRSRKDIGRGFAQVFDSPAVADWLDAGASETLIDIPAPPDPTRRLSLRLLDFTEREMLLVVRDITKLMHLEQVRRDFVANVSHELRTPLTVVHGYLDMIEPEEHPEWAGLLREMRIQSQRMTQIVEDLLTLSRLESQEHAADDPIDMTRQLVLLRREAEALSGGRHRVETIDDAGIDLMGSPKELHSAFSNLVTNAVRYTPDGGLIEIRFSLDSDGSPRLTVKDSGQGISAQHLTRITERFYRVSNSRSRETGGTGLGLSIVKHVLSLHRGHLDIRSELGVGSEFSCVLAPQRALPRDSEGSEAA